MSIESKHAYRFGFLKSEEWETLRLICIATDEGKCVICGKYDESNDAHHLFYRKRWSDTRGEDLLTLCRTCHQNVHDLGADILVQRLWERYESIFKQQKREGACCCCKETPEELCPLPVRSNKPLMACKRCVALFIEVFKEVGKPWPAYSKAKELAAMRGVRQFRADSLKQFVLNGMDKKMERDSFARALVRVSVLIKQHLGIWRPQNKS